MPPDTKAETFLRLIRRSGRGRLKIYLGYCPGVGKTCRMLEEGHRLVAEGIDLVVGLVETHGREGTIRLVAGLPLVAPKVVEYKGIRLEEMDLDAILERKPQVVLVDELAHTNVPGSRNAKRWEDVEELLAAGIHVVSTVNVQHLESLYDKVEGLVGIKVRERLPDSVVMDADEVVNVDLSEEDLVKRLEDGHIYPASRVPGALANYFQVPHLERLREMALRELAQKLDQSRKDEPVPAGPSVGMSDLVMVGVSSRPETLRLLRHASRLAGRLSRDWYAVHVETPKSLHEDARSGRQLADALALAGQLGATVFTLKGDDVAGTLLSFAREYRVGHLVVGRPRERSWWRRVLRLSVAEDLLHRARGVSVDIVDLTEVPQPQITPVVPAKADAIESLLAAAPVVVWDRPVSRDEAMEELVRACVGSDDPLRLWEALDAVRVREASGSTFLPDGIAIPHGRLANLPGPLCAIGVSREGVPDAPADHPVEIVFLLLTPREDAKLHLKLMSGGVRILRDRDLRKRLSRATDPASGSEVLRTLVGS